MEEAQQRVRQAIEQVQVMDDPRECYQAVRNAIRTCEQNGVPVPRELIVAEETTARECALESQGR